MLVFFSILILIIISVYSFPLVPLKIDQTAYGQETDVQFRNYVSEKYRFSIDIPVNSSVEKKGAVYDLIQLLEIRIGDNSKLQVSMDPKEDARGLDLKTYVDTLLNISLSKTDEPVLIKLISGPNQSTVGGEPAYTMTNSYIFALTGEAYQVSQTYVLFHGDHLYLFDFRTTPDEIDLIQSTIQKMINSVKFL